MRHLLVNVLLIAILLGAAAAVVTYLIYTQDEPKQAEPRRVVQTVLAPPVKARRDYRVQIVGYGSARPRISLDIAPQVAGEVVDKAADFLSGKHVREGQMLYEIDQTDYVLARDSANRQIDLLQTKLARLSQEKVNLAASETIERRRLDVAAGQLERTRSLFAQGGAGQTDVDAAEETALLRKTQHQTILNQLALIEPQRKQLEAEIAVAKVQLARAETDIKRTKVVSPLTGRVLSCSIEIGERVSVGQVCGQAYGTAVMDVAVPIPAGDLTWIAADEAAMSSPSSRPANPRVGAPVEVVWYRSDGAEPLVWQGMVGRIEAGLAAETRTATVNVEVTNPDPNAGGAMLERNMFCKVTITGRVLPKAYILPRAAMLPDGWVYVAEEGKLRRRKVKVARWTGEEVMLLPGGGVADGDRVIVGYVPKPVPGMAVRPVDSLTAPTTAPTTASTTAPTSAPTTVPATAPAGPPGGDGR